MMQHVATIKSDIAAFATDVEISQQGELEVNQDFGKLLQDHNVTNTDSTDKAKVTVKNIRSEEGSETDTLAKEASLKQDVAASNSGENSELTDEVGLKDQPIELLNKSEKDTPLNLNANEGFTQTSKNLKEPLDAVEVSDVEHLIDAENWVALVGNLKKLNGGERIEGSQKQTELLTSKSPKIGDENTILDDLKNIIVDIENSNHERVEQTSINKELLSAQTTKIVSQEDNLDLQLKVDKIESSVLEELKIFVKDLISRPVEAPIKTKGEFDISALGDSAISLLEDNGFDISVLAEPENRALLRALLSYGELGQIESTSSIGNKATELQDAQVDKLTNSAILLDVMSKKDETAHASLLDNQLPSEVSQQVDLKAAERDEVINNSDIKALLKLPAEKLDKVLTRLSENLLTKISSVEQSSSEVISSKIAEPKATDLTFLNEVAVKDVVAAVKTGITEFKSQASQGREPGIDLKTLVTDAVTKVTEVPATEKTQESIEQVTNNFSKLLDFAQTFNRQTEQQASALASSRQEVAQIQAEQSKQLQFNQLESKFEKAVNIQKPEGHQQLAEKVRWMVNTRNLIADIRLDPAELGSVQVRVSMNGEAATVNFVVQSQQARDAVDSATPRLREMLADKGIELGQSSVRQENNARQQEEDKAFANNPEQNNDEINDAGGEQNALAEHRVVNGTLGGIDYFA